jgi:hypothetical protein
MLYEEKELLLKLFTTHHLNVPERQAFPDKKIPASKIRALIEDSLSTAGWFPGDHPYPKGDAGGEYLQLEKIEDAIILHLNTESSYCHYSHKTENFNSLSDAINAFR